MSLCLLPNLFEVGPVAISYGGLAYTDHTIEASACVDGKDVLVIRHVTIHNNVVVTAHVSAISPTGATVRYAREREVSRAS